MRTIVSAMALVTDMVFCGAIVFLCYEYKHQQGPPPPSPVVDWSNAYESWGKNTGEDINWPQYDGQMQPTPQPQPKPKTILEWLRPDQVKRLPPVQQPQQPEMFQPPQRRPLVPVQPPKPKPKPRTPRGYGPVMFATSGHQP